LTRWWKKGRVRWRDVWPLLPFFAIGGSLGLLTAWLEKHYVGAQGAEWSLSLLQRFLVAGRALCFYVAKLVWPMRLTFIYPRWEINPGVWWQWTFPIAAVAVVIALWLMRRHLGRGPLVAVLFFAGTLIPALGFVNIYPFRFSFVADHFQYLASAGLIALAGAGLSRLPRVAWMGLLAILALLTWRQASIYRDLYTLWHDTLLKNPRCWMAHSELGLVLEGQGRMTEAVAHYRQALELKPDSVEALVNLGNAQSRNGQMEEAIASFRAALDVDPGYPPALNNLGNVFVSKGRLEEAMECYRKSIQVNPNDPEIFNTLGATLAKKKQYADAIEQFEAALQLKRDQPAVLYNLGNTLASQGKFEEAIANYQAAIQVSPDYMNADISWGAALIAMGKPDQAVSRLNEALRIKPDNPETHFYLGYALAKSGRPDQAVMHLKEALRLKPNYPEAQRQLRALGVTLTE